MGGQDPVIRALWNFTMESLIYANASENKHFPLALWQKVSKKGPWQQQGSHSRKQLGVRSCLARHVIV